MSVAYVDGRFSHGYAPTVIPSPAPVSGWAVIEYDAVLQSGTEMVIPAPVRLPIIDGRLCDVDGAPGPVEMQATDDPALFQDGALAKVTVQLSGSQAVKFSVPLPAGETVQLHTVAPGGPDDGRTVFVAGVTPTGDAGLTQTFQDSSSQFRTALDDTYVERTEVGSTVETPAGAQTKADAAETEAKTYAGTLAYGTNLEATDATVAAFVDDPGSQTGAALSGTYTTRQEWAAVVTANLSPAGLIDFDTTKARVDGGISSLIPVEVPTYDGSDVAVHPSVYYNPDGWNGYLYWMAMTPYPGADATLENPSILCSNDGISWQVPNGLVNPIDPYPGEGSYNSDPYLTVANDGTMYCWWRWWGGGEHISYRTSRDGVEWSSEVVDWQYDNTVVGYRLMSPSVIQQPDGRWIMYAVDIAATPYRVIRSIRAVDGTWATPEPVTLIGMGASGPWHIDVHRVGGQWQMLVMDGHSGGGDLRVAVSNDGLTFTVGQPFIVRGSSGAWNSAYYKSCFLPATRNGVAGWDVWFGGANFSSTAPIIYKGFVRFDDNQDVEAIALDVEILKVRSGVTSEYLVIDTFDRDDTTDGLGTSDTGQVWETSTSISPFRVVSKQARAAQSLNTIAVVETGRTDNVVSSTVGDLNDLLQWWLITRFQNVDYFYRAGAVNNQFVIQKVNAGSVVQLASVNYVAVESGNTIDLSAKGSTLTLYYNSAAVLTATDTDLITGTKTGIQTNNTGTSFDMFTVKRAV